MKNLVIARELGFSNIIIHQKEDSPTGLVLLSKQNIKVSSVSHVPTTVFRQKKTKDLHIFIPFNLDERQTPGWVLIRKVLSSKDRILKSYLSYIEKHKDDDPILHVYNVGKIEFRW